MPETVTVKDLLAEAAEKAKKYDWPEAARLYARAIAGLAENSPETGQLVDSLAEAYFEGAFQAESRDDFKQRMARARDAFERAESLHGKAGLPAKAQLSKARRTFANYWVEDGLDERKRLVQEGISQAEEAAKTAEASGDKPTLAEAERDQLEYNFEHFSYATNYKFLQEATERIIKIAEKAVADNREADSTNLLECLFFGLVALVISRAEIRGQSAPEVMPVASQKDVEIRKLAETIGSPYGLFLANTATHYIAEVVKGDFAESVKYSEAALSSARQTGDKGLIGRAGVGVSTSLFWSGVGEEDYEKRRSLMERAERKASLAAENLRIPLLRFELAIALETEAEANNLMAISDTDIMRKKEFLRRAIQITRDGLRGETHPRNLGNLGHPLSKALYFLSTLDVGPEEKSQLLEEALRIRRDVANTADASMAPNSWDQGVNHNYLALIKGELAGINPKQEAKVELLESACSDMERCLSICTTHPTLGQIPVVARYAEWYGDLAEKLLDLTHGQDAIRQGVKAYETAIEYHLKANQAASVPSIRWKLAQFYDKAGNLEDASREFQNAAGAYRGAKCPGCDSLFADTANYMEAWSLIEKARLHHSDEQYLLAAEEYQRVYDLLREAGEWEPLSKHYLGCSYLEGGEALGRQERPDSSKESFQHAVAAFQESKNRLGQLVKEAADPRRIGELKNWMDLNDGREKYSLARIQLEDAKLLDKTGNKEASASRYRSASTSFRELVTQSASQQAKAEFETLSLLCEAWGKMKEAEASASPELYAAASKLFLEIEKTTQKEKLRVLAMANSSICKALEDGTRFRRTRNTELYSEIKKHLEASADYYREAGFKNAADWTRATQRMFDALVYLTEAEVERDPRKKTEHYHLAEKQLQLAAKLYGDAGFQAKKEEALANLERAKEEKALLLSPLDALAGNPVDSAVSVAPVSLVKDQAVGLERFEEASVVGTLRVPAGEVGVGSDLTIELELANIGKTAATLMKLENVSAEGLELDPHKAQLKVEGNFVDLRGKRLEYMKTHDLKIPLRARKKGSYNLRPRIMFVDERGTYKSYDFEPVALQVRELGISGWLKGPKSPTESSEF